MRTRLLWAVVMMVMAIGCGDDSALRFAVAFEDHPKLEKGDPVVFKEIEIGTVTGVDLDASGQVQVAVEIEPKYRTVVTSEADYRAQRVDGLSGLRGKRHLVVIDRGGGEPLTEGAVVRGSAGALSDRLDEMKEGVAAAWDRAGAMAEGLRARFESAASSEEAQELSESLEQLVADARESGEDGWQRLREETLPKLEEQAKALRRQLEEEGYDEDAEKLWRDFTSVMESLEEHVPPPPTATPEPAQPEQ